MEHFLITWHESGDEIHFMVLPMTEYVLVDNAIEIFSDRTGKYDWDYVGTIMDGIIKKSVKSSHIQTYCSEPWDFSEFNIVKIISLPEFGS